MKHGFLTQWKNAKGMRKSDSSAWLEGVSRLEAEKGIVVRFIVGNSADPEEQRRLDEEEKEYQDFLRLPITVLTTSLLLDHSI